MKPFLVKKENEEGEVCEGPEVCEGREEAEGCLRLLGIKDWVSTL